jgi:alcohol dehydrogenase class IV
MNDFPSEVLNAQKVIFRKGAAEELAREASAFGKCGLIVHGKSFEQNGSKEKVLASCRHAALEVECFARSAGEPALDEITQVINQGHTFGAHWIAGIGGGSVLDLAKAAAGLFYAREKPVYYQEGGTLEKKGIPFIAVPTTAGTGSEATPNSVIINPEKKTKLSIRDKSFMARTVVLDPELLSGLPSSVVRFSGMDAFVQAYESFTSKNATAYSDFFALKAVELLARQLPAGAGPQGKKHFGPLLLGSYFAGVALAAARLGVIHGIAHPLGALYHEPHGLICSVCLVPSIKINRQAMGKKYDDLSRTVGGDLLEETEKLISLFQIESPFRGKEVPEREKIIAETLSSGSTAANPKTVLLEDVEFILDEIFRG